MPNYRFGRFEVRPAEGLLLRDNLRVKLEDLPLQLLLVLLEKPGEVVTKDTLRKRLWGDRIFGEMDSSLQVAVAKLREALGETATAPQYIETIRRRGYRFNGDVETAAEAALPIQATTLPSEPAATSVPSPLQTSTDGKIAGRRRFLYSGAALCLVLAIASVAILLLRARRPPVNGSDEIAVGSFVNASGDASYNGIGYVFRVKLEESPYLNLISEERLLQRVPDPASAPLEATLRACADLGGKVLLTGSIQPHGAGYQITTTARSCGSGKPLVTRSIRAESHAAVLAAMDEATNGLRRDLGESSASLQRFNVPLEHATTSSLAALRAFTLGEDKRAEGHEFEAIPDYKLAVDLDPGFALAYARLGTIYSNAAETTLSRAQFQKAFDLREHTTDRERLYIAAHFYSESGQVQRAIDAYELWRSLYPRDPSPLNNLVIEYLAVGDPDKALGPARTAVELDRGSSLSQAALARVYLELGEQTKLQGLCDTTRWHKGDSAMLHETCFLLDFLRNNDAAMQAHVAWSHGNAAESELMDDAAWVAMYQGRLALGQQMFADARRSALAQGFSELAATVDADEALLDADLGSPQRARLLGLDALRLAPNDVNLQASAALALARSGDTQRAEAEAKKVAASTPLDTIMNGARLPVIRAAIQMQSHNYAAAVQILEPVRPYDTYSALALAPAYYRGLALQSLGQSAKSIAEFRSVLSHRMLSPDSPYVPLAEVRLSEELRKSGDVAGAAEAERQVAQAWQHASPGLCPTHMC